MNTSMKRDIYNLYENNLVLSNTPRYLYSIPQPHTPPSKRHCTTPEPTTTTTTDNIPQPSAPPISFIDYLKMLDEDAIRLKV